MARTPFEKYGGFATVSKIVMAFYDRVLDSDIMAPFFDDVDMRRLTDHQTKFISQALGGPAAFTDDMLRNVHAGLGIDQRAFDEMIVLFEATLREFELEEEDIHLVLGVLRSSAPVIIVPVGSSS
jgi:hemoglobin